MIAAAQELNFAIVVLDVDISAVVEVRVMLQLFCGTVDIHGVRGGLARGARAS